MTSDDAPRVPDDWFVGFHRGLAARFWRAAGATMADDDVRELLACRTARACSTCPAATGG